MKYLNYFIIFFYLALNSTCVGNSVFYNLGEGFKYGYYDSKKTLNVYYEDQGIVHGVCFAVQWNDEFILMKYHPYDSLGHELPSTEACLIRKSLYAKSPMQLRSEGVISNNEDSITRFTELNNIKFKSEKSISSD